MKSRIRTTLGILAALLLASGCCFLFGLGDFILIPIRESWVRRTDLSGPPRLVLLADTAQGPRLVLEEEVSLVLMTGRSHSSGYTWAKLEVFDLKSRERVAVEFVPGPARCFGVVAGRLWCVDPAAGLHARDLTSLAVKTTQAEVFASHPDLPPRLLRRFTDFQFDPERGLLGLHTDDARAWQLELASGSVTQAEREIHHRSQAIAATSSATIGDEYFSLQSRKDGGRVLLERNRLPTSTESFINGELLVDGTSEKPMVLEDPPSFVISHADRLTQRGGRAGLKVSRVDFAGNVKWTYAYPGVEGRNQRFQDDLRILRAGHTEAGVLLVIHVVSSLRPLQTDLVLLDPRTGVESWHHGLTPSCGSNFPFFCTLFGSNLY